METLQAIKSRRSIRKFKSDMIPKDILDKIIEAEHMHLPAEVLSPLLLLQLLTRKLEISYPKWIALLWVRMKTLTHSTMHLYVIVLANKEKPTYIYDGTLVMENLMLAAHDLGIGSCWIHRAKEEFESEEGKEILKSLGINGNYEGIGHCVLGYADCEEPTPAKKERWLCLLYRLIFIQGE